MAKANSITATGIELTQAYVQELFLYDPDTGTLFRRTNPGGRYIAGQVAGYITQRGYRVVEIGHTQFQVHRIAWLYTYGRWPDGDVDHIDGDTANNALSNLRDVSHIVNGENVKGPRAHNKLGLLGVYERRDATGKYRACIRVNKKTINLGTFSTAEEAHEAYLSAKRQLHAGNTL